MQRGLRAVLRWRVRFSLRTLLLVAAGLSAGIGAKVRFDENPWQQTWRWTAPDSRQIFETAQSPDGRRFAAIVSTAPSDAQRQVLQFDATDPEAAPKPLRATASQGCRVYYDTSNRVLIEEERRLLDAESGDELLAWDRGRCLKGVSEDGRTAVVGSSPEETELLYPDARTSVWDLEKRELRITQDIGSTWLDGPRCTPAGTRGVTGISSRQDLPKSFPQITWPQPVAEDFCPQVTLWDLDSGKPLDTFDHEAPITGAALSRDGRWLLCGGDGFLERWDIARHSIVSHVAIAGRFLGGDLGLDGTRAICFVTDNPGFRKGAYLSFSVGLWDLESGNNLTFNLSPSNMQLKYHSGDPWYTYPALMKELEYLKSYRPHFTHDGTRIVGLNKDATPVVLDARSGKELAVLGDRNMALGDRALQPASREALLLHKAHALYGFERVRPEGDERLFWIPEFWLAAFFALLLPFSLWRDGRMKKA